jgi:hypothetical protein
MAEFKANLRAHIIANPAVFALIGDRCYSFPAPQGAIKPYIVLQRISEVGDRNLSGTNERYTERWQVNVYSSTETTAEAVKEALKSALDLAVPFDMTNFRIYCMYMEVSGDEADFENEAGQESIINKRMDFIVIRKRSEI